MHAFESRRLRDKGAHRSMSAVLTSCTGVAVPAFTTRKSMPSGRDPLHHCSGVLRDAMSQCG